jgi:hypothetical protein
MIADYIAIISEIQSANQEDVDDRAKRDKDPFAEQK